MDVLKPFILTISLVWSASGCSDQPMSDESPSIAPVVMNETDDFSENVYLFASGTVNSELNDVEFRPTRSLPSSKDLTPTAGDYRIDLIGFSENTLASVAFDVQPLSDDSGALFNVPLPQPLLPIARLELWYENARIASLVGSRSIPDVEVLAPLYGDQVALAELEIQWQSTDSDGDDLSYFVFFSSDDGNTWTTIASNLQDTTLRPLPGLITSTDTAHVFVTVNDGVNASFARSGVFSVQ